MIPRLFLLVMMSCVLGATWARATTAPAKPAELAALAQQVETELRSDILPFWMKHVRDPRGGFFGYVDNELMVKPDAPRGALLTARILWTYAAAYRRYRDPAYLEMAHVAYDELLGHFWDRENGGLFWSIKADGTPLDTRKVLYVQAFGIYGLTEYYRAINDRAPLDRALDLYRLVEAQAHDREHLGYFEEFTRDWKVWRGRGADRGGLGSAMGSLEQKSQNVHLHLLEAYTNLYRAWPDPELKKNLREITDLMLTRVLDTSTHHLRMFLSEDWTPRSDTITYGHDIEFSWLLVETAEVLGDDKLLAAVRAEAVAIAQTTLAQGVDPDGGVLAEANPKGYTHTYKEWWAQAEAAVGFLNAYQISGDDAYLQASRQSWAFIQQHLVDRKNGEWYRVTARDGTVASDDKASFWKCPYHNGRACLQLLERLETLSRPR